ncbi:MAG: hypothetical protein HFG83_09845 [Dorea sp.]|jgi:hypothetical protein|nr:hypothetical protein [Dorea sp.]MCI9454114.1 hypothetical protein [Dorea sp.]
MKRRKILLAAAGVICGVFWVAHVARLSVAAIHVYIQSEQMNSAGEIE